MVVVTAKATYAKHQTLHLTKNTSRTERRPRQEDVNTLSPERPVLRQFPPYDLLFQKGLERHVGATLDRCNWLQRAENGIDQLYAGVLHAAGYPEFALKRADIEWTKQWYGVRAAYSVAGGQGKALFFRKLLSIERILPSIQHP